MARLFHLFAVLLSSIGLLLTTTAAQNQTDSQWPLHDNGLNEVVQWDHYSFQINGQRIFIFSGEFHYWRIPVPGLWRDILEKIKATGFTAFAFYSSWAYHAPNNHTVDFSTGARDIVPIYELAKELGMYLLVRPGPYVNAEASAGGYPLWVTTGDYGSLRNDDARYTAAWQPYFAEVSDITSKYQVTDDHNVFCYQIENEYGYQWIGDPADKNPNQTAIAYMELLKETARANGINVPLSANDPNMNSRSWGADWSNAGGNVDIPGLDSYPSCWTCDVTVCTSTNGEYVPYKVIPYYDYFQEVQPSMPAFMPEFQGGSYNPWAGPEGGCPSDTGANFANLFYRWNIAQRVTAMSLYMLYGGTNWGSIAAPVTATSYDYSAPISEDRSIGTKFYETKLLSLFTRSAKDLTMTERVGNGTQYTNNPAISAYELRNPETNGAFYVTLHTESSVGTDETFKLRVNTSAGALTVPSAGAIRLNGFQSKIVVTDFRFGAHSLLYSTAEVLTYAVIDGQPTIALWVPKGEEAEFAVRGAKSGKVQRCPRCSNASFSRKGDALVVHFTQEGDSSVLLLSNGVRVILLDRDAAYHFWAPALTNDPFVPEDELVFVQGPYLVRSASLSKTTLALRGDSLNETAVEVFAPKHVNKLTWNGKRLRVARTAYGSLTATLAPPPAVSIPSLAKAVWRAKDSLPERLPSYDDSGPAWVDANHMTTQNPSPPATLPVLYADEYGFHNGVRLWRGVFSGPATGVFLNIQGGAAFGWSAYLNGHFLGAHLGDAATSQANKTLTFPSNATSTAGENILLIIHDDTGHDQTTGALNPRGILEARLLSSSSSSSSTTPPKFTSWRVAGTAGGESDLDPIRGVYNEDGLFAERVGWHLPGFNDKHWPRATSLSFTGATVQFFRTVIPLHLPRGIDTSISFVLGTPAGASKAYRAQLFVNGYQYGRYHPHIGNQVVFPVPAGILDLDGENTVAVAVWAQSEEGAEITVDWKVDYVVGSSLDVVGVSKEARNLRPGWDRGREAYA
ncbi:hypothetical protein FE257_010274 [Aspergillus nanangensis]|uniref:beta-galactosidase n=1 Tax=Aspergillus nanangensis TaxID=2582783 RepID=A0AAD4CIZ0_ASPNN|nr:hypothetical protein FE257_010274 [Aspergillus nanangensis]